jgi:hypothetical protein
MPRHSSMIDELSEMRVREHRTVAIHDFGPAQNEQAFEVAFAVANEGSD